ncbi:hypothetical protein N7475_000273 [Penicillium sp. IBT 31633x]|nr:hypothetical protein N7475_000273 [Penicillium sp. IBT 31633x]
MDSQQSDIYPSSILEGESIQTLAYPLADDVFTPDLSFASKPPTLNTKTDILPPPPIPPSVVVQRHFGANSDGAAWFLICTSLILQHEDPYLLHKQLNEELSTNTWSDAIERATLRGLENAIKAGAEMARAATEAAARSKDAAIEFATDHPVYATLIALGIFALLTPWALEIIGFGDLGPIEGSFAAAWQRQYAGYVPKRALFGFFRGWE